MEKSVIICVILAALLAASMVSATTYDLATVAQHNTHADCWVAVQGKVYNLTPVVVWHANVIQCGQDNTAVYIAHHMTLNNINPYYIGDLLVAPAACSYTYSSWSTCQPDNTQTRTVLTTSPSGCTGTPVTSQACTYVPPSCAYTYSSWTTCQSDNTQTRTVLTTSPSSCTGTPVTSQACAYIPPTCAYTYSSWSTCQVGNTQTRTVLTTSPSGCTGTPSTSQVCTYVPPSCAYTYSSWGSCQPSNTQTRTVLTTTPSGCAGTPVTSQSCPYRAPALVNITPDQLKGHSSNLSCWVAVFGKVYDVTPVIPDYGYFYLCGADNSAKWSASIFGNDTSIMQPYLIGNLVSPPANATHEPKEHEGKDEEEDSRGERQDNNDREAEKDSEAAGNRTSRWMGHDIANEEGQERRIHAPGGEVPTHISRNETRGSAED